MRKKWEIIIYITVILLIARLLLPHVVLKYVNNTLSEMEEYYGYVEDIDIALFRGAYVINDINILKKVKSEAKDQYDTIPFFFSPEIDLSVHWRALFKGHIVGEIYVESAVLNFVKGKHKEEDIHADTADFRKVINDLMPLTINHFQINNSQIHYIDPYSFPQVDIFMHEITINADNLSNVNDIKDVLPSTVVASGRVYDGDFRLDVKLDALARVPTFDLNAELRGLTLKSLNNFLLAYGNFDVKSGNFNMYTEFAAKNGEFGGYVKPLIKDIDIVQWNKEEGDVKQVLWETIVGVSAEVFQNQRKEQLASKIKIEGKFDNPHLHLWAAISYVLRNAFVNALKPAIDNTINIHNMREDRKTILEKLFSKQDENHK